GSRMASTSNSSSISSQERSDTTAPRCGTIVMTPSASSWRSASRTGIRLTWNSCAIASWRSCSPSRMSPRTIFSRSFSATAEVSDLRGMPPGGEPTRVVTAGGPDLGRGSLFERLERFRVDFDWFRSAVVNEPRGSDAVVGALLCEPSDPVSVAGVIFFNNVGYLGMCGHGTIGLVVTLAYMGRIAPGGHKIETPVGTVSAQLHTSGE